MNPQYIVIHLSLTKYSQFAFPPAWHFPR
jgi:hypothetical protein